MIRCVRMWTGGDGNSLFEEGWIDLAEGVRGDFVGLPVPAVEEGCPGHRLRQRGGL
jgi:hypothetical protein